MSPRTTGPADAAARWRRIARAVERDRLRREERLRRGSAYTGVRARSFTALSGIADRTDPFFRQVRRSVGRSTTVLDVGAGAGRYALALAPLAREVTAVDPSAELLSLLRRESHRRALANIRCVVSRWEDVDPLEADVAVCYGVMGLVKDAARFFAKLDAAAKRRVFVGVFTGVDVVRDPLWPHFHGAPRPRAPTHLDAVAVLRELGITPDVRIHELSTGSYGDLEEAVEAYHDLLELPKTRRTRRELESVLSSWLVRDRRGDLRPPFRTGPWATVSWAPASQNSSL